MFYLESETRDDLESCTMEALYYNYQVHFLILIDYNFSINSSTS